MTRYIGIQNCGQCPHSCQSPGRTEGGIYTTRAAYPLCAIQRKENVLSHGGQISPGYHGTIAVLPWAITEDDITGKMTRFPTGKIPEWCPLPKLPGEKS